MGAALPYVISRQGPDGESGPSERCQDPADARRLSRPFPPPVRRHRHDKLREECGVFGVIGRRRRGQFRGARPARAAASRAGGRRHRRPRPRAGFNSARRFGYVRDNFTKPKPWTRCPGRSPSAMSAIPPPAPRARRSATCSRSSASSRWAARRSRITATSPTPRAARELIERGSIFQSSSDTECIIHLMARSMAAHHPRADGRTRCAGSRGRFPSSR
jgi:amidophosphoribosyltransferase